MDLPQYKCHKVVRAAKITEIERGSEQVNLVFGELQPVSGIYVNATWAVEKRVEVGGYYVVYDDGYTSFSPAKAFEEGYAVLKVEVKQVEGAEIPAVILAASITQIAEGMKKLVAGPLNERALIILLKDATGVPQYEIKNVLDGLGALGDLYIKKPQRSR